MFKPSTFLWFILVVGCLIAMAYSSKMSALGHKIKILKIRGILKTADQFTKASKQIFIQKDSKKEDLIKKLILGNTANTYLATARYLMTDKEMKEIVENFDEFVKNIEEEQEQAIQKIKNYMFIN